MRIEQNLWNHGATQQYWPKEVTTKGANALRSFYYKKTTGKLGFNPPWNRLTHALSCFLAYDFGSESALASAAIILLDSKMSALFVFTKPKLSRFGQCHWDKSPLTFWSGAHQTLQFVLRNSQSSASQCSAMRLFRTTCGQSLTQRWRNRRSSWLQRQHVLVSRWHRLVHLESRCNHGLVLSLDLYSSFTFEMQMGSHISRQRVSVCTWGGGGSRLQYYSKVLICSSFRYSLKVFRPFL